MNSIEYTNASAYQATVDEWMSMLETILREDPWAPTSILNYYLCDEQQGMFCPLGYDEYELHGKTMRIDGALLSAAEKIGFFASAVPEYVEAALDNFGSWHCICDGVEEILSMDFLRKYVPFRHRVIAQYLLDISKHLELDEDDWKHFFSKAEAQFGEELKGY